MAHRKSKVLGLALVVPLGLFFASPAKALVPLTVPVFDPINYQTNERHTTAYYLKEFVIYPLVRKVANSLENKLVNKVSGQVAGINGALPSFITNWRNHILDSQARGNDVFRAVLADTKLCSYFSNTLKQAFGADLFAGAINGAAVKNSRGEVVYQNKTNVPGTAPFQLSANCTLPGNFDINTFKKDFSKGGWDAWDKLIQPQNNFFGAYALALQEQQKQIAVEGQASENSSIAGQGFLSQKLGVGNSGLGPTGCTDSGGTLGDGAVGPTKVTRCVFQGKEVTPAQILGQGAVDAIDKKLGRVGSSTQIADTLLTLFNAVLDATTSKLANYIGQNTYNRPPDNTAGVRPSPPLPFPEAQFEPNSNDVNTGNAQGQGKQIQQQCLRDCLAQEQANCAGSLPNEQTTCSEEATNTCNQRCGVQ